LVLDHIASKGEHMKKSAILVGTIAAMTTAAYAQGTSPPNCPPGYQCIPQPNSPAAAGAGVAQADESPWAKLRTKDEQTGNKQICVIQHWGLGAETGIVLGTVAVRSVEGEDKQSLLLGVTTAYSLVMPAGVQIKIDDSARAKGFRRILIHSPSAILLALTLAGCANVAARTSSAISASNRRGGAYSSSLRLRSIERQRDALA
jgi:invasion protein IalB